MPLLEDDAHAKQLELCICSIAISLKRIADTLDAIWKFAQAEIAKDAQENAK